MKTFIGIVCTVGIGTLFAAEPLPPIAQDLESNFACPESLPTEQVRLVALGRFLGWVKQHHPDWTVEQTVRLRVQLLQSHHCEKTLEHIGAQAPHEA